MQYGVYCLLKARKDESSDRVLRVKVIAESISEAIIKAKELFTKKLRERKFNVFMYETYR